MTSDEIKGILKEIQTIKATLTDRLQEIDGKAYYTKDWKQEQKAMLRQKALEDLAKVYEHADEVVNALAEKMSKPKPFNYSDPLFMSAIQFISTCGDTVPETAWKQIIRDFEKEPEMLSYLRDAFQRQGLTEAAVVANEAVREVATSASLPDRIGDAIYYACNSLADTDFSGIESELDALGEASE